MIRAVRGIVFLILALTLVGCGQRGKPPLRPTTDRLPRVETVHPTRLKEMPIWIEVNAVVEAMEKADLYARVSGIVATLQPESGQPIVDIGRSVRAGEPLIELAVPELHAEVTAKKALLAQAESQEKLALRNKDVAAKELEEARKQERRYQAEHAYRQLHLQRVKELAKRDAVQEQLVQETHLQLEAAASAWETARTQIETKQAKLASAEAEVQVAASRVKVAEAEVERAQTLLGYATIHAPFNGVVTRRHVDRGAMVKDSVTPLLTVMRTDMVRVLLDIPERHVPMLNSVEQDPNPDGKGDRVTLRIASLGEQVRDGEFVGHLTRLAKALDPATRTMRAEVYLENSSGFLRPGMYGTATVLLESRQNALTIPATALVRSARHTEVFIVENPTGDPLQGIARRVTVELGLDDGLRVEVRSGLKGGEYVIAKGAGALRDGDPVVAVPNR
jgi:RND family efflux transporter MFP subunit